MYIRANKTFGGKMKTKENVKIKGVYEKDLDKFLDSLGLLDKINRGEILCHFCRNHINKENFGGIIRLKGVLQVFCDDIDCYLKMIEEKRKNVRIP